MAAGVGVGVISGVGVAWIRSVESGAGSGGCAFFRALQDATKMTISAASAKPPVPMASSFVFLSMLLSFHSIWIEPPRNGTAQAL